MNNRQLTEEKVFSYVREHHMLQPQDRVVAGVSGGADSVCLLFVLLEWAKHIPLELAVVHVNHGIRQDAAEDACYVQELCRQHGLAFYLTEVNVREKAALEKCSEEETGRKVRYEAFAKAAEEFQANKIAVAHNSNDRSETMLFHLFRGSGIKGLGSIQPIRDNIIRPILCLERGEIEDYLAVRKIAYCQDSTNEEDDYTRNRIRHHILPYVEKEIVQGCVSHMAQAAEMLSETEDYLKQQTQAALEECVEEQPDRYEIMADKLKSYHPIIQKRILHHLVKQLSPHQKDISYVHIQELCSLFAKEGNRVICLPFGIRGRREYDKVFLEMIKEEKTVSDAVAESEIMLPGQDELPWSITVGGEDQWKMVFSVFKMESSYKKGEEVPQNEYTKWFDYDKIEKCLTLRTRKTGDYLTIASREGTMVHKSIKDYFITQKIPRTQRDKILLLTEKEHVLWVVGHRISEYYKISENTKYILQVQLEKVTAKGDVLE